jgi:hypothetical protein
MILDIKTKEGFDKIGNNYGCWYSSAKSLLLAVKVLKEHRNKTLEAYKASIESNTVDFECLDGFLVLSPELMLRGYAIECLLKGLWVIKGNKLCENGEFYKIPDTGNHELLQLAKANKIRVTKSQRDLLVFLTEYVKTFGRYPVPTKCQGKNNKLSGINQLAIDDVFDSFIDVLLKEYEIQEEN